MTAIALAGVLGGPLSGWIMDRMGGVGGLRNWEWLYLLEGLPSVIVGVVVLLLSRRRPGTGIVADRGAEGAAGAPARRGGGAEASEGHQVHRTADAFRTPAVWVLSLIYFGCVMGIYGVTFWLPQIISETITRDPWRIGLVSMIPWGVAAVTAVLVGASSDRQQERRWHIAGGAAVGAVAFALSGLPGSVRLGRPRLSHRGHRGRAVRHHHFWSLPTAILSGSAAAAGIAWINSLGNLSGYVSPFVVGLIRDATRDAAHPTATCCSRCVLAVSLFGAGGAHARVARDGGLRAPGSRLQALIERWQRTNRTVPGMNLRRSAVGQ